MLPKGTFTCGMTFGTSPVILCCTQDFMNRVNTGKLMGAFSLPFIHMKALLVPQIQNLLSDIRDLPETELKDKVC